MKKNSFKSIGRALLGAAMISTLALGGCGDSDDFIHTNTQILAPPTANNDAFNALGDATVNQAAAGVLANDAVNGAAITAFDATGSNGGTIALNPDGSFTYTPVFGFVGAETFTYTLTNNLGTSTGTVTMTSTGRGRFVNNTANPGGNGSQAAPFDTLAAAIAAANAGDTIFVSRGDGTNTGLAGAVNLPANVDLVGEGTGLILPQTVVPAGQAPLLTGPITCGGDNTLSGLTIDGAAGNAIVINSVGNVTISDNTISNPGNNQIAATDVSGTLTIRDNTFEDPSNVSGDFISIFNNNTNGTAVISGNTFTNTIGNNFDDCLEMGVLGTSVMDITISNNTAEAAVADQLNFGFAVLVGNTAQATVLMDSNRISNLNEFALTLVSLAPTATINGTITNNTISNVTSHGLFLPLAGQVRVANNTISNVTGNALSFTNAGPVTGNLGGTIVVESNNISNSGGNAVAFEPLANSLIAVRNNTLTGSGASSLSAVVGAAVNLCLQVTGNTVDDNMNIDTTNAGANIDLENGAAGLETVNTFTAGTPVINNTGTGTVTNRAAGFCNIP